MALTYEQQREMAKEAGAHALALEAHRIIQCVSNQANDRGTSDRALMALIVRAAKACMQANMIKTNAGDWAGQSLIDTLGRIEAYPECEECDC